MKSISDQYNCCDKQKESIDTCDHGFHATYIERITCGYDVYVNYGQLVNNYDIHLPMNNAYLPEIKP